MQLQRRAQKSDENAENAFWLELMTYYTADEILVGDETAKDRRVLWRRFGYGPMGGQAYDFEPYLTRGKRVSALTYMSMRGFEDWRYTHGTFDADGFQYATDEMLLSPKARYGGATLASRHKVLLMDRASIHKNEAYLLKLNMYICVKLLPVQAHRFSPLDNGAYGWCVRFLQAQDTYYGQRPIQEGLDAAFRAMPAEAARMCYANCKYYFP